MGPEAAGLGAAGLGAAGLNSSEIFGSSAVVPGLPMPSLSRQFRLSAVLPDSWSITFPFTFLQQA